MTVSLFLSDVVGTITLPDGVTVHAHKVGWVRSVGGRAIRAAQVLSVNATPGNASLYSSAKQWVVWAATDTREICLWYREAHLPDAERDAEHAARRFVAACKTAMTGRAVTVDEDLRTVSMDPPAYADNDRKVDR